MKTAFTYQPQNNEAFIAKALAWAQQFDVVQYTYNNGFENGFKHLLGIQFKSTKPTFPSIYEQKWQLGFIGYDYKNNLESAFSNPKFDNLFEFPDFYFFEPDILFILENENIIIESKLNNEAEIVLEIENYRVKNINTNSVKFELETDYQQYLQNFEALQNHILQGNIYIANYCISLLAEDSQLNPVDVFLKLNSSSPTPFASFVKFNEQYLICASPERFIKKEAQKLISQPIKGTYPRGKNEIEDQANISLLKNSIKEQTENVMIVDLVRNDLSRICNQVKVDELFGIYTFETVHQMISTISGNIKQNIDFKDIIQSLFPMGSMTGAPKINAVNLCTNYENFNRQLYSGCVGYIDPKGNFDFNVVIRSILHNSKTNKSAIRVGSAITYAAQAEQEWNECLLKAKSLINLFE